MVRKASPHNNNVNLIKVKGNQNLKWPKTSNEMTDSEKKHRSALNSVSEMLLVN